MIAIELAGGFEAASDLTANVQLFTHAVSLGSVDSLIQHPAALTHRPVQAAAKPSDALVRLSIGLEHPADLIADLEQAFAASAWPATRSGDGVAHLRVRAWTTRCFRDPRAASRLGLRIEIRRGSRRLRAIPGSRRLGQCARPGGDAVEVERQSGGAGGATRGELVHGVGRLRVEVDERRLDLAKHLAHGDAEDALPAADEVDDLVVRGAEVDRGAVAHERRAGEIADAGCPELLDGGADLLQRDAGVEQALHELQDQDVAEAVEPLRTEPVAPRTVGSTSSVRAQ